jgi:lycopene beta-cyclase
MSIKSNETFDFLFIGMGAANCLLLLKLHEENLLVDKKIAIIEPNSKIVNDRNFCFWSTEEELLTLKIEDLVSSKWQKIKVADREYQNISPLYYYHVKGIDLYNKAREILKNLDVKKYIESFEGEPILNANTFEINLINGKIKACKVFDSRPPVFESAKKNQSHILQSFYGWEINTKDYIFDTSSVVMMDFNIPQNNFCQFMYILPFSENTALFEVTRFGKEKISKDEAVHLLTDYIKQLGFSYQILDEEVGVIPMSSLKITDTNYGENWILTGARANMIKPTTGYAFHNMVIDACNLAESISKQQPIKREKHNARFNFYDHLLLKIIEETPQQGKKIFQKLFNNTPINEVLLFLSEKSIFNLYSNILRLF